MKNELNELSNVERIKLKRAHSPLDKTLEGDNLKIYQVFINNKKCFTSTNQHEIHKWLMDKQELWLNPNEKHKIFGLIHNAQNNKFENMYIDTIVLDEYDNVLQNDKE